MNRPLKRRKVPSWLAPALGYGISGVSLAWVLYGYPLSDLLAAIKTLDWKWVTVAVIADLAVYVCHAWRWNTLLAPISRLKFWRTVQAIYIGLFANEVLPLRTGELIRCYLLAHWNNIRLSLGFASAAVERLIDGFYMLAAFIITAMLVRGMPAELTFLVQILGALMAVATVGLGWVILHKQHAHAVVRESRWGSTLRHVVEGLHLMGNARTLGKAALISLIYLALNVLFVYGLMRAYGLDLSFWAAAGVLTVVRFATVVPNAPGNLGLAQVGVIAALTLFEVERNDAKTFSFVMFALQNLPLLLGGALAVALTGLNIRELRDRARRGAHEAPAVVTD